MRTLKSSALYFAIVFGIGFLLGPIRLLWAVPRFGERTGELMEAPFMFLAIVFTARWVSRRAFAPKSSSGLLALGLLALAFLLATELLVMRTLRGLTLEEYLSGRDPVGFGAYVVLLILFAVMPVLMGMIRPKALS